MYKFAGLLENTSRGADLEGLDGIFYTRLSARLFAPFFSVTVFQPNRRQAWRLRTEPFDYRNAQHSGALVPRDGEWYTRSAVSLEGDMELVCPTSDTDLPSLISVRAKLSWWPAHATFTWLDGGSGFQKLSARPPEECKSEWISVAYDDTVFTDEDRKRFPRAFLTQPIPAPPRPDPTPAANAPTAPIPVTEVKNEQSEHSHSGSSQDTESDYYGGWWNKYWHDNNWSSHHWDYGHGGGWSERDNCHRCDTDPKPDNDTREPGQSNSTAQAEPDTADNFPSHEKVWADANPETPRPHGSEPNSQSPNQTSNTLGTSVTDPVSYRVEQVTVHTKTQSVEVRPSEGTAAVAVSNDMIRLQRLAITGAPLTREDRLARQSLASHLSLSPELYNLLVFGETEDTDQLALPDEVIGPRALPSSQSP